MFRLSLSVIPTVAALCVVAVAGCGRTALLPPQSCEVLSCPLGMVCEAQTGRCVDPSGRPDGGWPDAGHPDGGGPDGGGPDGGGPDGGGPDGGGPDGGHGPCPGGCPPAMFCDLAANGGGGACVTCNQNGGCSGATPHCDTHVQGGLCVQCLRKAHCPPSLVCQSATRTCGGCTAHDQCEDGMYCATGSECRPVPDTCSSAQTVNFGGGNHASFTAVPHVGGDDTQDTCNPVGGPEVVYRFLLNQTRNVTVTASAASSGTDPVIYLRAGNCQSGMPLSCQNGTGPGGSETTLLSNLGPGEYFLFVENVGAAVGPVNVTILLAPPVMGPANDTCAGRQALTFAGNTAFAFGSTLNATNGNPPGATTPACAPSARQTGGDVVYEFTLLAPQDVTATVTALSSSFRPAVYLRGPGAIASCDGDTHLGCAAAPVTGTFGPQAVTATNLAPGTYYVWVDGVAGTSGTFSLQVTRSAPVSNDSCANAQPLVFTGSATHQVGTASGDTSFATNGNQGWHPSPSCSATAKQSGKDVVYRYTLPTTRDVTIKVTPTGPAPTFQPVVYVRSSPNCDSTATLSELGCAASNAPTTTTTLQLPAQPGGTYFLWVDGALGTEGAFDIEVTAIDPNPTPVGGDHCPGAPLAFNASGVAQVASSTSLGTNSNASGDATPTCATGAKVVGRDLVYTYFLNNPRDVTLTLTPTSSTYIPTLYVKGGSCNSNAISDELACVTRTTSGPLTYKLLNQAPGPYWIFVDSTGSNTHGTFILNVEQSAPTPPPPNDNCGGASQLTFVNGVATASGDTSSASNSNASSDASPTCSPTAKQKGRDLVYQYTLSAAQDVTVTVTPTGNTGYQPVAYVRGPGVGQCGSISAGSEEGCAGVSLPGPLAFTLLNQAPGTYSLYVDGGNDTYGAFNLAVSLGTATSLPDACADAEPLTLGQPVLASTALGSDDYSRQSFPPYGAACLTGNSYPFTGRDLVYRFTATQPTHTVTLTPGGGFDAALLFLRPPAGGTCSPSWCEAMSDQIGAGVPESMTLSALIPGRTYYLVVDAWTAGSAISAGNFTLVVQ